MPNGSRSPCTTSVGTVTSSSSWRRLGAGVPGTPTGRLQRERETEDPDGAERPGGAAGDPRAQGPAAGDERQPFELAGAEILDDGGPRGVELARRRG